MKRLKEILYSLTLGLLFFCSVQFVLFFSEKPSDVQRIPSIQGAHIQFTTQPFFVLKQLLNVELLQVKDQKFLQRFRGFMKDSKRQNQLGDIQMDLKKPLSLILFLRDDKQAPFVHFYARQYVPGQKIGKHYIQQGSDVFFFPTKKVNATTISWVKNHVNWKRQSIKQEHVFFRQSADGKTKVSDIHWKDNVLQFSRSSLPMDRSLILTPRFFHYSHLFPKEVLTAIPKDLKIRNLFEHVTRFSINYENGNLTENEQFPFAPSFEVLMEYRNESDMEKAIEEFKRDYPALVWTATTVEMGTQTYYFKRINPRTLYVCSNQENYCPSGLPTLTRSETGFLCKGELSRLTTIKNTGWAGLVLDMIPAFRASKELFDGTSQITSNQKGISITFKKGHKVAHEVLKAFLIYVHP